MIEITNGSLKALMQAAVNGPFMQAEIVSLSGKGKLRADCGLPPVSLVCNFMDKGEYLWQFIKVDDQHIALAPVNSCIGQTIYASVRDDNQYYLQMRAPNSFDWITAIQRDEVLGFRLHDMNIAQFTGFNGKYLAVNKDPDYVPIQRYIGYRIRSMGETFDQSARWLINVKKTMQSHISFSGAVSNREALEEQLTQASVTYDDALVADLSEQLFS